jgi:cell division protein FtsI (penicillin-binding protein 3)
LAVINNFNKKYRLYFICFIFAILSFIIIGRMIFIVAYGNKNHVISDYNDKKDSKRGSIIDRNGVILAGDVNTKSLYVKNRLVKNSDQLALKLARFFNDLNYQELKLKLENKTKKDWVLIKRNLSPNQVAQVKNMHIAGLVFQDDKSRIYPHKSLLSHVVGYSDIDRNGLSGIELSYNKKLHQGKDIQIAIDVRVQDVLDNELRIAMKKYKSKAAAGIIMDVNNGEVIALASLPNFDPNNKEDINSTNSFNRIVSGVYELGSVLKILTYAIAFEDNLLNEKEIFYVKDPIKYGKYTIKDDHYVKDNMNYNDIFIHSSNIGTVKIAKKIGAKRQKSFFEDIGFLKKLDSDFVGLATPIIPKRWSDISLYTISFGHGIAITPLHLAVGLSAIVNGGNLVSPSFLKMDDQIIAKKIISQNSSEKIRKLMANAVSDGTGKKAAIKDIAIGGKTGTAEKAELGSYNKRKTIASFAAAFPIENPEYLIYILFDNSDYIYNSGGMLAAPIVSNVISKTLMMLHKL